MECRTCKFWDNKRSENRFTPTINDYGPYPTDRRVGTCLAASNYSWGRYAEDRPFNSQPPKMMPTDWTRYHAILYTREDHGCLSFSTATEEGRG